MKYQVKKAHELERGDQIIIHGKSYRVDEYIQWGGAGSFDFGEWGCVKFWKRKHVFSRLKIVTEQTYKDAPYFVMDKS